MAPTHVVDITEAVPRVVFSLLEAFAVMYKEMRWLSWAVDAEGRERVGVAGEKGLGRGHTN